MTLSKDTNVGKKPMRTKQGPSKATYSRKRGAVRHKRLKDEGFFEKAKDYLVLLGAAWFFLLGVGVSYFYAVRWVAEVLDLHFWDITITGLVALFVLSLGAVTKKYRTKIK